MEADSNWDYTFDCSESSKMPSFELLYGGYWFEVTPDDYIIEISTGVCSLCFSGYNSIDYWILGDAFMRGWYNIHDHTNKRMGFIPFSGSAKSNPTEATSIPTTPLPLVDVFDRFRVFGIDTYTFLVLVIILGCCTCGCVFYVIYFCYSALFKTKRESGVYGKEEDAE